MEIKVANEAKQDTIIGQGNQILSKINNRQVFAQCVKSVQRGTIGLNSGGDGKVVSISPVNANKSILIWNTTDSNNSGNFILKNDGIYLKYTIVTYTSLCWQVIEFY